MHPTIVVCPRFCVPGFESDHEFKSKSVPISSSSLALWAADAGKTRAGLFIIEIKMWIVSCFATRVK
ncbi:hypothetical protein EPZ47_19335 [Pseudomonas viciae]|uniref:Uncharacterized protein n=1 Tax=Pseudomonas viciae TaxID=2505979 RepID=A0A4P7PJ03_9PSED|nr:hypothetical protein EPZ47_19335 [Pseudomonas viciae]